MTRTQAGEREESGSDAARPEGDPPAENLLLYCPVCSSRLEPRKCKRICVSCGYYMSCSDYC